MNLYHYFDQRTGPFRSLSELPDAKATALQAELSRQGRGFAAKRPDGYLKRRRELETLARRLFMQKGGQPVRLHPHYMVVEACDWLMTWYGNPDCLALPLQAFNKAALSFSYGDLFPTFSPKVTDGREYRGQIYTHDEILDLIERFGLPQHWNPDGKRGPERYIEALVWEDEPIKQALSQWQTR